MVLYFQSPIKTWKTKLQKKVNYYLNLSIKSFMKNFKLVGELAVFPAPVTLQNV